MLPGNEGDVSGRILETRDSLKLEYVVAMTGYETLHAVGLKLKYMGNINETFEFKKLSVIFLLRQLFLRPIK